MCYVVSCGACGGGSRGEAEKRPNMSTQNMGVGDGSSDGNGRRARGAEGRGTWSPRWSGGWMWHDGECKLLVPAIF